MNMIENDILPGRNKMRKNTVLVLDTGQPDFSVIAHHVEKMSHFLREVATFEEMMRAPGGYTPDIIVLDIGSVTASELEILSSIRGHYGDVPIVIVSEALDDAQVRKLLKLKVHDWLRKPVNFGEFLNSIQSGIRTSKQSSTRVHAIISAVGGSGATTVAVSLSEIIARRLAKDKANGSVALFDLDFSTGSCGYLLNLTSGFNLDSVISNPSRIDSEFVNLLQQKHDHGMIVYSFKRREVVTSLNCYELVLRMLDVVTVQHTHTVLDIPYYETDWRQDVLSGVNTVTIVCEMNLPSIKHTMDMLESIREMGGPKKPVHVLINKRRKGLFSGDRIPKAKLKQLFGETPFDYLPDEHDLMAEAMDRGVTLSDVNSSSKFLKALTKYANDVVLAEKVQA
ncbi:response regulator [Seohaeicola saemankumensis]|uniref:Response regulator n=1 Tax=Seohaeicola saemankumensis TaxID=481181 RepID=A0ABW3TFU3_9RHOB